MSENPSLLDTVSNSDPNLEYEEIETCALSNIKIIISCENLLLDISNNYCLRLCLIPFMNPSFAINCLQNHEVVV